MSHSRSVDRPEKPYADFPLHAHASGQWAKKIGGTRVYFGGWADDPNGKKALAKYHDRIAGRPAVAEGLTVAELCNRFLTVKQQQVEAGKRVPRTLTNYKQATDILVAQFGKFKVVDTLTVADFERLMAEIEKPPTDADKKQGRRTKRGPASVGNIVQVIRMVFRYAYDCELIDKPVRFGPTFKRPSRKEFRKVRADKGSLMFTAEQIRALLAAADVQMRAMILLGVNAGFGNADCGQLPQTAIQGDWLEFPRPKTAIPRRCPLWKETAEALRQAIAERPLPKDTADVGKVFITKYGQAWFRADETSNPISAEFKKLLNTLGLYRRGLGFYSLRRTFETVGGESLDQIATSSIMGHAEDSQDMAAVYRQRVSDERLQAVVDHVHAWLFPPEAKPAKRKAAVKKRPSVNAK